jgi:hypothetical protein
MKCIVPLAGPDFFRPEYGIKPLVPMDGVPLIERVLSSRPWRRTGELTGADCVFVLRDGEGLAEFTRFLDGAYPEAKRVVLSHLTGGALLSALAGASELPATDEPLIVDLVDIVFASDLSPRAAFAAEPALAGLIPYFEASDDCYSYLELDGTRVVRTAEKVVISTHASAGVYLYRTAADFLVAASGSLAAGSQWTHRGLHFMCPSYNALIATGRLVRGVPVTDVIPVSAKFHSSP